MNEKLNAIKAADIMSRFAITTKENASISDLAHLLMRFKVSGVPVVGGNNEIAGIITATDLFKLMEEITEEQDKESEPLNCDTLFVRDIMTKNTYSVSEETSLLEIIKLMCGKKIHTLPVITNKEIVGIIGRRDVINAFYAVKNQNFEK